MIIYIGIDDTDNLQSRGTGQLARRIAVELSTEYKLLGVTRHQLLVDERIPYTSHNSSAAITVESDSPADLAMLFERLRAAILSDFQPGSDPGLCVASQVPGAVTEFGRRTQVEIINRQEALNLAAANNILLSGLGGSEDGVIGALAAVGLAASGDDGRYLLIGKIREISGLIDVEELYKAGIVAVQTLEGEPVLAGPVLTDKLRPARRGGKPVQFVTWQEGCWHPVKLD